MTRSDVLTYLQNQWAALATETGQATTDTAAGFGPAIDSALRALGYGTDDLATADVGDATADDFLALADYYAVVRFARAMAIKVDMSAAATSISKSRSQAFNALKTLIEQMQADLKQRGYLGGTFSLGRINLDYLEPEATA